jgi:multicomponent Na+:H+ antiporter subunit D
VRILPVLPITLPLLVAAVLLAAAKITPRVVVDATSTATAAAAAVASAVLAYRAAGGTIVYWLSGWTPVDRRPVGIPLVVDPAAGALAAFAGLLVCAALVYSWRYFEEVETFFHVLMLLFLAAMVAFCLVGDLFTLFVSFELMTVAAVALTAYHTEDRGPIQGALGFGVTNLVGSFLALTGVALLYGRAGTLNLAAVGAALAGRPADGLVGLAFVLICVGFLVKAAVVPFHFWLADAHAVAPAPVSMLLSGIMVPLGLYGVARMLWVVFAGLLAAHVSGVLVAAGMVTALVGAVLCPAQRHLKRLLAYSTISHVGMFLVGLGLLSANGLAGFGLGVVAHGLVKAALFCSVGVLLNRYGSVSEHDLHGQGRDFALLGTVWAVCGLALADLPGSGLFLARARIEEAASAAGYGWVAVVFLIVAVLTGGAVLRAGSGVFLGWGLVEGRDLNEEVAAKEEEPETPGHRRITSALMVAPAVVLAVLGLGLRLVPGTEPAAHTAAERLHDGAGYAEAVLGGSSLVPPAVRPAEPVAASSVLLAALSTLGAVGFAALSLRWHAVPKALRRVVERAGLPVMDGLRRLHSGYIGDHIAWLTLGTAVLGGLLAVALR